MKIRGKNYYYKSIQAFLLVFFLTKALNIMAQDFNKLPERLIEQLKDGGKMIVPVGPVLLPQSLKLITKRGKRIIEEDLLPVRFVPMIK